MAEATAAEAAANGFLEVGGLWEAVRLMESPLNNFWKKLGFLLESPTKQTLFF